MLQPLKACLIIGPAILARRNSPVAREVTVLVPVGEVILACTYDERWDRLAFSIDRLNDSNPFPVSGLD